MWAEPAGDRIYPLENIPFFIYGVSRDGIVSAQLDTEGRLQLVEVSEESGNRTLRALSDRFVRSPKLRNRVKAELAKSGASSEELRNRLLAIDVPRSAHLSAITVI